MVPELYPEETVMLEVRRHWFLFFVQTIFLVILICLPFFFYAIFSQTPISPGHQDVGVWFSFGVAVWFLIVWIMFFIAWTNFYLDAWVITDKRIIDIEQLALFNRTVSEFRIDNIQEITIDIPGFIPTALGFGDVLIETAAEKRRCVMKDVPHPEKIKALVSRLQSVFPHKRL